MNREVCKFFSGSLAALAYVHVAYAVATSRGIINEPVFRGRRWGVGPLLTEAAVYAALSLVLGYVGWSPKPQERLQYSAVPATNGESQWPVGADEHQPASH